MKSDAHRKLVIAKVNSEFEKYRTFSSLPVIGAAGEFKAVELQNITDQEPYVTALFNLFNLDPSLHLAGREGNRIIAA